MILPIIYAGMGIAFFTCLVLITRRPLKLADIVVIILMLFLSIPMLFKVSVNIIGTGNMLQYSRLLPLGFGPCLFLYARVMTDEMSEFNIKYLLHFGPLALALMILLVTAGTGNNPTNDVNRPVNADFRNSPNSFTPPPVDNRERKPEMHRGQIKQPRPPYQELGQIHRPDDRRNRQIYENIINPLILASFIFYTISLIILLRRHYRKISEYYSYNSIMVNLGWLKWITICFFLSYGFILITFFISPAYIITPLLDRLYTPDLSTVFFIVVFGLFAIKQPVIFKADNSLPETETTGTGISKNSEKKKYEKSGLKEEDAEIFFQRIEDYMEEEKPYLDSDLTIVDLSEKLNIPKHYVTEIINKKNNTNFYMFVNYYRIEEAKKKLRDEEYKEHSIIRIAYDCGFNSKSTFNNVFKKKLGTAWHDSK